MLFRLTSRTSGRKYSSDRVFLSETITWLSNLSESVGRKTLWALLVAAVALLPALRALGEPMKPPDFNSLKPLSPISGRDFIGRPVTAVPGIPEYNCTSLGWPLGPPGITISLVVPVQRFVGAIDANGYLTDETFRTLFERGFIAERATITLRVRARDSSPGQQVSNYILPVTSATKVWVNEQEARFLRDRGEPITYSLNDSTRWRIVEYEVDMRKIRFSNRGAATNDLDELPTVAENSIRAQFPFVTGFECYAIADATITIRVVSPVVLVHGINSNAEFWNVWGTRDNLVARGLIVAVVDQHQEGGRLYPDPDRGGELVILRREIAKPEHPKVQENLNRVATNLARSTGAAGVHFYCYSKGGLDTFHLLVSTPSFMLPMKQASLVQPTALSVTTVATPHLGSPVADLISLRDKQRRMTAFGPTLMSEQGKGFFRAPGGASLDGYTLADLTSIILVSKRSGFSGPDAHKQAVVFANGTFVPEYFPDGWESLRPFKRFNWWKTTGIGFRSSATLDLNAFGFDADQNGNRIIDNLEAFGLLATSTGPLVPNLIFVGQMSGGLLSLPASALVPGFTQSYNFIGNFQNIEFDTFSVRPRGVAPSSFYEVLRVDAKKRASFNVNDIVVPLSSSNPAGFEDRFLYINSFQGQDGRDHNFAAGQSRLNLFQSLLISADKKHGGLQ